MTDATFPEFNAEPQMAGTPSATAFLTKGAESVWIHAFPAERRVEMRYPAVPIAPGAEAVGLIRDIPARDGLETVLRFSAEVRRHREDEWTLRSDATALVWAGDPWDFADPFTTPCTF